MKDAGRSHASHAASNMPGAVATFSVLITDERGVAF